MFRLTVGNWFSACLVALPGSINAFTQTGGWIPTHWWISHCLWSVYGASAAFHLLRREMAVAFNFHATRGETLTTSMAKFLPDLQRRTSVFQLRASSAILIVGVVFFMGCFTGPAMERWTHRIGKG
jgi:hypothetical protein